MRQLVVRFVAITAGLSVGLVLCELVLRLAGQAPTNGVVTVTEREYAAVPGVLSPGQRLVDRRNPKLPYLVSTNSLGYRGAAIPLAKPAGEVRILLTGDSFAFGDFVDDDRTLPAQLERHLSSRCRDVRVINAGLDDATIVDESRMIERGLRVAPDIVVLLFSENDVTDLNRESTWDRLAGNRRTKSSFPMSLAYPVLRHTALWNFALTVRATIRSRDQSATPNTATFTAAGQNDALTRRLRDTYRGALAQLRDSLQRRGIPLRVVVFPSHFTVSQTQMREQVAWMARTAADEHVPLINLLDPLAASGLPTDKLYLLPWDGHPSSQGYEIAAAWVAQQLRATPPLAGACHANITASR